MVYEQQYFPVFDSHYPFQTYQKFHVQRTYTSYVCIYVCTWHRLHILETPWLLWLSSYKQSHLFTSINICTYKHSNSVFTPLVPMTAFTFARIHLVWEYLENNPQSPALNTFFGWYSVRSDGSTPVFQAPHALHLHFRIPPTHSQFKGVNSMFNFKAMSSAFYLITRHWICTFNAHFCLNHSRSRDSIISYLWVFTTFLLGWVVTHCWSKFLICNNVV
jgi:hypothetical protein